MNPGPNRYWLLHSADVCAVESGHGAYARLASKRRDYVPVAGRRVNRRISDYTCAAPRTIPMLQLARAATILGTMPAYYFQSHLLIPWPARGHLLFCRFPQRHTRARRPPETQLSLGHMLVASIPSRTTPHSSTWGRVSASGIQVPGYKGGREASGFIPTTRYACSSIYCTYTILTLHTYKQPSSHAT